MNKKYIKQVFGGESQTFLKIVKDNLSWLLEKYKYDYNEEQVHKVLDLIHEHHDIFVKPNNPQLKIKLDVQLQKFLAEQGPKFTDLKLQEKYGSTFFTADEQKANHELQLKQNVANRERQAKAQKESANQNLQALNPADFPAKLEEYFA